MSRDTRHSMSADTRDFLRIAVPLTVAEFAVVFTLLGWDGTKELYRMVWDMITW